MGSCSLRGSARRRGRAPAAVCSTGTSWPERAQVRLDLGQAADVARWRSSSAPVASRLRALRCAELGRGVRLLDVVGAGRAAAQLPLGGLDERDAVDRLAAARAARAHALGVGEVAGVVVGDGGRRDRAAARRAGRAPRGTTLTSTTRSASCSAASCSGSPRNSRPYSRIPEPQPAALVRIASTSPARKAPQVAPRQAACACAGGAGVHRQRAAAALRRAGSTVSTPLRASTRSVAQLMSGASTCCAQPASSATRARRSPSRRVDLGQRLGGRQPLGQQSQHRGQRVRQQARQRAARGGPSRAASRKRRG